MKKILANLKNQNSDVVIFLDYASSRADNHCINKLNFQEIQKKAKVASDAQKILQTEKYSENS